MRKMKSLMMLMAIAAASFTFTSCDDDPWDGPDWDDPYGWYDDYNHGGWGWNQGDWNQGSQGSQDSQLLAEAQALVGEWEGPAKYSYIQEDGESRGTDEFYANMIFYQNGNNNNSLSGNGVEIDTAYDENGNLSNTTQTLKFSWYVDNNGDIYIKYTNSGATFVMDAGASQYGFSLNVNQQGKNDTFAGYMIGTGSVKGDVIYIDLERANTTDNARKAVSRASGAAEVSTQSFGKGSTFSPLPSTAKRLNSRR